MEDQNFNQPIDPIPPLQPEPEVPIQPDVTFPADVSTPQQQAPYMESFFAEAPLPNAAFPEEPTPPVRDPGKRMFVVILLFLIATLLFCGYCIYADISNGTNSDQNGDGTTVNIQIGTQNKPDVDEIYCDENGKYTTEGIALAVRPSIVEIFTYTDSDQTNVVGSGSGIIISEDGYIVTNSHVLEDASFYFVYLSDGTMYNATLVGRDAKTDIAVLKISGSDLTVAVLGNSDEVVLGEEVVAIGNPAGLSGTLTNGIVSGLQRKIKTDSTGFEMTCIQTNAAISPGNSGGALVNMYGQVIGITSSKYVSSSYEGLGFAITINEALPLIEELIANGYIGGRFRIGITFVASSSSYTKVLYEQAYGEALPDDLVGLWITEIDETCDIANTDLQPYDFITAVEGAAVSDYASLYDVLEGHTAGDVLTADCVRVSDDGTQCEFTISFALMEDTSGDF